MTTNWFGSSEGFLRPSKQPLDSHMIHSSLVKVLLKGLLEVGTRHSEQWLRVRMRYSVWEKEDPHSKTSIVLKTTILATLNIRNHYCSRGFVLTAHGFFRPGHCARGTSDTFGVYATYESTDPKP